MKDYRNPYNDPADPSKGVPTIRQHHAAIIAGTMEEYGCSREDAEGCIGDANREWSDAARAALRAGWIPSQAWINSARETSPDWWDRRICHDMPDVFDRLAKAGRSLYKTKQEHNAAWAGT